MKNWKKAELFELEIDKTEYNFIGETWDGFYLGRMDNPEDPEENLS